jgi:MAP7 domain-containing protein 1
VYQALAEPDVSSSGEMGRIISKPLDAKNKVLPDPIIIERRSLSETYPPAALIIPPIAKSSSVFSNFMRRKKKPEEGFHEDVNAPPPIPPKDKGKYSVQPTAQTHILPRDISKHNFAAIEPIPIPRRRRTGSLSEYAVISHSNSSDEVLVEPGRSAGAHKPVVQSLPLRSKRDPEVLDPVERAQRRLEAQQRREIEMEIALREEAERQAELRRRKEQLLKEEQEAEAQRRASLEDELRRITGERKRKALLEHEEEARRQRALEERKRLDKERRLEEHKRLEEWRREQTKMADEAAQREKELRRQVEDDRRRKIQIAEAKVKRNKHVDSMLTGWVTMQISDSLFWKRRFFKFVGTTVHFYRSPKVRYADIREHTLFTHGGSYQDPHQVLDTVELYGKIQGIREWNEGYEDLEAIPYSFVVEFVDDRGPWSMFADSEDEKVR